MNYRKREALWDVLIRLETTLVKLGFIDWHKNDWSMTVMRKYIDGL